MNQRRTAIPAPIPTLAAIALCALAALLSGCLLVPGHFTAALDVRRSGAFTYAYAGEIAMFPLTKLAQAGAAAEAADAAFQPSPCHETPTDNQAKPQGRPCTPAELAEQKQAWSKQQSARAETRKHEAESFKAMLGGLDPSDPKAGEQFAERLRKQQGWRRVIYKGDGLFDVDFVIAGRLDRDFAFPTIERFAYAQPFLTLSRRRDGSVRLDAPGFSALASGGGANPLMAGLGMAMAKDGASPSLPQPEGSFTLTTDAEILANNTEDGAKPAAAGKRLGWTVAPGTQAAPMAVLQLAIARQGQ